MLNIQHELLDDDFDWDIEPVSSNVTPTPDWDDEEQNFVFHNLDRWADRKVPTENY